jgi:O-antigen/teichoic acid export membrane protein
MGIIRNQSIKSTIITYIGFLIGAINIIFVMPKFFSSIQYGLITVFVAFATQTVTIGSFGMGVVINKFLPYYRSHLIPKKRDLLTIALVVGTIGMTLILGLSYLNKEFIIRKFAKNSPLFVQYMYLFPLFAFGYFFYYIFDSFSNNYKFTVWSSFVRELFYRLFNLLAALLFAIRWISFHGVMDLYLLMYWMGTILLIINLFFQKLFYIPLRISSLTHKIKHNIAQYSLSAWGTGILSITFQFIDTIAIAGLIGLAEAGIYSIVKFIISPMIIPGNSVITISVPLISDAWRRNDLKKIEEIYKKSALALMIIGGFTFFIIWTNVNDILHILPDRFFGNNLIFNEAKYSLLILGIMRLCDFSTSVNSHILQNSRKYYLVDLWTNIISVIISIPVNYFLIKKFGFIGAATAFLFLAIISNGFKTSFFYLKEKIHPFSRKWLVLMLVFILLIAIGYLPGLIFKMISFDAQIHYVPLLVGRIMIRSIILCVIFVPVIYKLNISEDITQTINIFKNKLFKSIRR